MVEGPQFYDPDDPTGAYAQFPTLAGADGSRPGAVHRLRPARAELRGLRQPRRAGAGQRVRHSRIRGRRHRLHQAHRTGLQPVRPPEWLNPGCLAGLFGSDPGKVGLVPRDADRRYLDHSQFKALFKTGQADAHGFGFVEGAENAATNGHAGYYSWSPRRGFRFIALDTVSEGGVPARQLRATSMTLSSGGSSASLRPRRRGARRFLRAFSL